MVCVGVCFKDAIIFFYLSKVTVVSAASVFKPREIKQCRYFFQGTRGKGSRGAVSYYIAEGRVIPCVALAS